VSRTITKEAHRRASFYCHDYGRPGATLLVLYALYAARKDRRGGYPPYILRYLDEICVNDERAAIMSVDRTSGLGLTYLKHVRQRWISAWPPWGPWLHSYRHLFVRPDIVADMALLGALRDSPYVGKLADDWLHLLPFDRLTVAGLRGIISSAQPEDDGADFREFLIYINYYIQVSLSHFSSFFTGSREIFRSGGSDAGVCRLFFFCVETGSGGKKRWTKPNRTLHA